MQEIKFGSEGWTCKTFPTMKMGVIKSNIDELLPIFISLGYIEDDVKGIIGILNMSKGCVYTDPRDKFILTSLGEDYYLVQYVPDGNSAKFAELAITDEKIKLPSVMKNDAPIINAFCALAQIISKRYGVGIPARICDIAEGRFIDYTPLGTVKPRHNKKGKVVQLYPMTSEANNG